MRIRTLAWLAGLCLSSSLIAAVPVNGGFENGMQGWRPLWTRTPGVGTIAEDHDNAHSGRSSARVEHSGAQDWSLEPLDRVQVKPGDVFVFEAWARLEGDGGSITLCVSSWDAEGKVIDWAFGGRTIRQTGDWRRLRSRFVVPRGVVEVHPRFIGQGPARAWVDDVSWSNEGPFRTDRGSSMPAFLLITNAVVSVTLDTSQATFKVCDSRTGGCWNQVALQQDVVLMDAGLRPGGLTLRLQEIASGLVITGLVRLDPQRAEFTLELDAEGELQAPLRFPHPFASSPGEYLVLPLNEGISYPVEDRTIDPMRLVAYGGHGICMAFWGATDGGRGHMAILETPDDAAVLMTRQQERLVIAPEWDPQWGRFGYARRIRYVFLDRGGHVAMAKRYRAHAIQAGLFKTLEQKRRETPAVDLLIGAVNVWCWDRDAVSLVKEMQAAGINRILWSNRQSPENLRVLNDLGVLTSRYDIYQDVMDPANFEHLGGVHGDWVTAAWPADIVRDASGGWLHGWGVQGKDSRWYDCGILCDRRALDYARERIPAELATHPYRCRFIDTTTAAPWHECRADRHPMTRTDSRTWKMELLRYVSEGNKLVTGCETGHDAAVPYLHYFEGMMSLGPYRVPDAGRDMARLWTNAPEAVVKFQLGHRYRLPLWELVYHECVVAQWYWGDYNNKLPSLWDKRDLFNVLYGTPPMFMFSRATWKENQARFVQSAANTCPLVREAGTSEMIDHRFLGSARDVQQTVFANGLSITVNFGAEPFTLPGGASLPGMAYVATRGAAANSLARP